MAAHTPSMPVRTPTRRRMVAGMLTAAAVSGLAGAGAANSASAAATSLAPSRSAVTVRIGGAVAADRYSAAYTDSSGTRSTYHLFTQKVSGPIAGVVVYLDGDGMYGHDHPGSTWALGGSRGVVASAAARGMATLSIRTPDRSGTATFWENGKVNAAYVAALTAEITRDLRTDTVWLVGYSGGSQLITRFLLPAHSAMFARGGAVVTGGGGTPAVGTGTMRPQSRFPLSWYTGSADDGRRSDDGYNALADAKRGAAWYQARGWNVTRQEPKGLDHADLGTRFGTVLTAALARVTASSAANAAVNRGWQVRVIPSRGAVAASVSFPRGTPGRIVLTVRDGAGRARTVSAATVTRSSYLKIGPGLSGRYSYVVSHNGATRATGTVTIPR